MNLLELTREWLNDYERTGDPIYVFHAIRSFQPICEAFQRRVIRRKTHISDVDRRILRSVFTPMPEEELVKITKCLEEMIEFYGDIPEDILERLRNMYQTPAEYPDARQVG
jgi:hypothetical protein